MATSDDYPDKAGKNADYAPFIQQLVRLAERSIAPYRHLLGRDLSVHTTTNENPRSYKLRGFSYLVDLLVSSDWPCRTLHPLTKVWPARQEAPRQCHEQYRSRRSGVFVS